MTTSEFNTKCYSNKEALSSFAYCLTQDREAAQDLYQETVYRGFKNLTLFRDGTNFRAWMFTIMRNNFINDYRKKSRMNMVKDATTNSYYSNLGAETIYNMAESNIRVDELNSMIDTLPDKYRLPINMLTKGYKYKEIALSLHQPLGTIKSHIFFARKVLIETINRSYPLAY